MLQRRTVEQAPALVCAGQEGGEDDDDQNEGEEREDDDDDEDDEEGEGEAYLGEEDDDADDESWSASSEFDYDEDDATSSCTSEEEAEKGVKVTQFELKYYLFNNLNVSLKNINEYSEVTEFDPRFALSYGHSF